MQISIVQSEIEQALIDWVNKQFKVADGVKYTIKLLATRGDQGFTGTIDIIPIGSKPETVETVDKARSIPFSTARTPEPGVEHNDDGVDQENPTKADVQTADEGSTEADTEDHSPANVDSSSVSEEPPKKSRSLFGGLSKPKNS